MPNEQPENYICTVRNVTIYQDHAPVKSIFSKLSGGKEALAYATRTIEVQLDSKVHTRDENGRRTFNRLLVEITEVHEGIRRLKLDETA